MVQVDLARMAAAAGRRAVASGCAVVIPAMVRRHALRAAAAPTLDPFLARAAAQIREIEELYAESKRLDSRTRNVPMRRAVGDPYYLAMIAGWREAVIEYKATRRTA